MILQIRRSRPWTSRERQKLMLAKTSHSPFGVRMLAPAAVSFPMELIIDSFIRKDGLLEARRCAVGPEPTLVKRVSAIDTVRLKKKESKVVWG